MLQPSYLRRPVTPPVSTSGSRWSDRLLGRSCCCPVFGGVVGDAVEPAAVDHPNPGSGEHADRVRVVLAAGPGAVIDLGGPGAGVSAAVGESGKGLAEAFVAGPPVGDVAHASRRLGNGRDAGEGRDRVG